jgi:hypothetical protein
MRNLPSYLREHSYSSLGTPGKGNFEQSNDKGFHLSEWLRKEPAAVQAHTDHLDAFTRDRTGWLGICSAHGRLSANEQNDRRVYVDIGGSLGRDALMFRRRFPNVNGKTIAQDIPKVIADASKALPPNSGLELEGADFFESQPMKRADLYLLHYILYDWADKDCLRIVNNTKAASKLTFASAKQLITIDKRNRATLSNILVLITQAARRGSPVEKPSNMILSLPRVRPHLFLGNNTMILEIVASCQGLTGSYTGLLVCRLLMDILEATLPAGKL